MSAPDDLYSFWHSTERFYPGLNLALYSNKHADTLLETIRQNLDAVSRLSELTDLVQTIMSDHPAAFLYSQNYLFITRRDLQGINMNTVDEPADRLTTIAHWYLKTTWALK
ncbi:hypothetical protein AXF24_13560 [Streptococcus pneumoniae]|uniref:hypothetical protein n=1 Tax=Streptococcus pneumoniae TaxID=1313 RepID=UPI0007721947|nr:hypothetical protein AWW74_12000 [Streptococcus pneumoniae]KWX83156.1 hypothetical protein AWW74_13570 [Streptococcus pneumoniae]KXB95039.1 hypothetical protein AXF24_11970 [Streptococcus pneumoniae]KXB95508.1 hypothetical protein AXF24_13560 [Streptococcus pneumoniae]